MTGNELKEARALLGLTQGDMAVRLGLTGSGGQSYLSQIETGSTTCPDRLARHVELLLQAERLPAPDGLSAWQMCCKLARASHAADSPVYVELPGHDEVYFVAAVVTLHDGGKKYPQLVLGR